nr:uncharacterized protein LOC112547065 [Pelodiscus sinensis]|eukprot:XP_025044330.1 uncharacterized protein LOC112547065 [Pelodiscus sinensis]
MQPPPPKEIASPRMHCALQTTTRGNCEPQHALRLTHPKPRELRIPACIAHDIPQPEGTANPSMHCALRTRSQGNCEPQNALRLTHPNSKELAIPACTFPLKRGCSYPSMHYYLRRTATPRTHGFRSHDTGRLQFPACSAAKGPHSAHAQQTRLIAHCASGERRGGIALAESGENPPTRICAGAVKADRAKRRRTQGNRPPGPAAHSPQFDFGGGLGAAPLASASGLGRNCFRFGSVSPCSGGFGWGGLGVPEPPWGARRRTSGMSTTAWRRRRAGGPAVPSNSCSWMKSSTCLRGCAGRWTCVRPLAAGARC